MFAFMAITEDDPKIYVSTDLVGVAMGSYQLALEVPVAARQSLMLQALYFDWQLGYMPELFGWYMGFVMDLASVSYADDTYYNDPAYEDSSDGFMQSYIDMFDTMEIKSYGGQLGLVKYSSNAGFFRPYSATYLGYGFSRFRMPSLVVDEYTTFPEIEMEIHSAILAGRFGGKAVIGFLAADLYVELALTGMYADFAKLIRSLGMDEMFAEAGMESLLALYMSPVSIMPSMNFGLRFSLAL
ncbi:MAG: hypothetical protein KKI09_04980 [Spirochaetes bacterium]|nr:hypothetical protein [Spirochaetota bacterium]